MPPGFFGTARAAPGTALRTESQCDGGRSLSCRSRSRMSTRLSRARAGHPVGRTVRLSSRENGGSLANEMVLRSSADACRLDNIRFGGRRALFRDLPEQWIGPGRFDSAEQMHRAVVASCRRQCRLRQQQRMVLHPDRRRRGTADRSKNRERRDGETGIAAALPVRMRRNCIGNTLVIAWRAKTLPELPTPCGRLSLRSGPLRLARTVSADSAPRRMTMRHRQCSASRPSAASCPGSR